MGPSGFMMSNPGVVSLLSSGMARRLLALVVGAALTAACAAAPAASPAPTQGPPVPSRATSTATPGDIGRTDPTDSPTVSPSAPPEADGPSPASGLPPVLVPLVPVTGFWSSEQSITRSALATLLAGGSMRRVYVATADLPWLASLLRVTPGANVLALAPADVLAAVRASPSSLGIVRADQVVPSVRALAVGGVSLFGDGRVHDLAAWPLTASEPAGSAASTFDPSATWTLVAGGDVMLDRYVYRRTVVDRLGADYPWNGGNARITSTSCCGYPGYRISKASASAAGTLRAYLRRQDLAIANLEGPAPSTFVYHPSGLTFSMDPKLLVGLKNAGIDMVSLANNHILNSGAAGISSTIKNLDALGIKHAGAGATSRAARQPAWLTAGRLKVAILAYNAVGGAPNATSPSAGAAGLTLATASADIRAARAAGADVVIVFPHWGVEYTDRLNTQQASLGPPLLKAGADAVIGGHSHWAGPIRVVGGKLIVYSMGDFVFDLMHDTRTQEGILVELTFTGKRLSQVVLRPTFIVGAVQPGFLLPAYGGSALLNRIHAASKLAGMP